jgi:hypothetical protein
VFAQRNATLTTIHTCRTGGAADGWGLNFCCRVTCEGADDVD